MAESTVAKPPSWRTELKRTIEPVQRYSKASQSLRHGGLN